MLFACTLYKLNYKYKNIYNYYCINHIFKKFFKTISKI